MRIYLDCCCYSRPFDDACQERVAAEAEAVRRCFALAEAGYLEIFKSDVLRAEIERMPNSEKRELIEMVLERQSLEAEESSAMVALEMDLTRVGMSPPDTLHLATAVVSGADYFLTVDDRLQKRALSFDRLSSTRVLNPVDFIREFEKEHAT